DAGALNLNAANALLKSVEEPRPKTIFVLVSSVSHRVVPTLVSRCQRIRFLPLESKNVAVIVKRHAANSQEEQQAAIAVSEGSVGKALALLSNGQLSSARTVAGSLLQASRKHDAISLFDTAVQAGKDRHHLLEALEILRIWLRDLLLISQGQKNAKIVNQDQLSQLVADAAQVTRNGLLRQIRSVCNAQEALKRNLNPTMTLETLMFQLRQEFR
ncbi:MAG: DNA polymerase III subunit delta' C-terminal domain-containing protein, partial [Pseudomonadota bacterium]